MTGSLSGRPVVIGKPVVKGTQVLVGNVLGAGDAVQVILEGYLNITRENLLSAIELRRPAITIRKGAVRGIQSVKFLLEENVPKSVQQIVSFAIPNTLCLISAVLMMRAQVTKRSLR